MLHTSEHDMAELVNASDIDVFLSDAAWAICSTYHTVLKASPGVLLMTSTLYFLLDASPLSNLASRHYDLRPFKWLLPTAVLHLLPPTNHSLSSVATITSHPPQLSLSSAAASCQPLSLSLSLVRHRSSTWLPLVNHPCHLLSAAITLSCCWLLHCGMSPCHLCHCLHFCHRHNCLSFVVVINCQPHLSLLLLSCNPLKLDVRWRGLEMDEVSTHTELRDGEWFWRCGVFVW
jgi:hypothetical protein